MRCHLALLICNSAVHCSVVQYSVVHYSALQCSAVHFSAVQCSAVQYSAVLVQYRDSVMPSALGTTLNSSSFMCQNLLLDYVALSLHCNTPVLFSSVRFSSVLCISMQSNAMYCNEMY